MNKQSKITFYRSTRILGITLLIISHSTFHAEISLLEMKGLFSNVNTEFQNWSPVNGAVAIKAGFLRNFYLAEVHEKQNLSATAKVMQQLFFLGGGDLGLKITTRQRNIGPYITPEMMADLVAHVIKTKEIDEAQAKKEDKELTKKLRQTIKISLKYIKEFLENLRKADKECQPASLATSRYIPYTLPDILMGYLFLRVESKEDFLRFFDKLAQNGVSITIPAYEHDKKALASSAYDEFHYRTFISNIEHRRFEEGDFNRYVQDNYESLIIAGIALRNYAQVLHPFPGYTRVFLELDGKKVNFSDCTETCLRGFLNELISTEEKLDPTILEQAQIQLHPAIRAFYARFPKFSSVSTNNAHKVWAELVSQIKEFPIDYRIKDHQGVKCEIKSTISNFLMGLRYLFAPTSDEVLGIRPLPEVITKGYFVDFFKNILAKASAAQKGKKQFEMIEINARDRTGKQNIITKGEIAEGEIESADQPFTTEEYPYVTITFLVTTQKNGIELKQSFIWHIMERHSWISMGPVEGAEKLFRETLLESVSRFTSKLASLAVTFNCPATHLLGLYTTPATIQLAIKELLPSAEFIYYILLYQNLSNVEVQQKLINFIAFDIQQPEKIIPEKIIQMLLPSIPLFTTEGEPSERYIGKSMPYKQIVKNVIGSNFPDEIISSYFRKLKKTVEEKKSATAWNLLTYIVNQILTLNKENLYPLIDTLFDQQPQIIKRLTPMWVNLARAILESHNLVYRERLQADTERIDITKDNQTLRKAFFKNIQQEIEKIIIKHKREFKQKYQEMLRRKKEKAGR